MGREVSGGKVKAFGPSTPFGKKPVTPPPPLCADWDTLGTDQYALQNLVSINGENLGDRQLINADNLGILQADDAGSLSSYTFIEPIGLISDAYYVLYDYLAPYVSFLSLISTFSYNPIPAYFNEMCIYFKTNAGYTGEPFSEIKFYLVTEKNQTAEAIIAESELITVPDTDDLVMQKATIKIDPSVTDAPVAIRIDKNYVKLEFHYAIIGLDGERVSWVQPSGLF